ncbi:MAG: response regulator [Armatimonadota bacterium]|nr:MAG: response regulator [Armatimonadota bacterium]
MMEAGRRAERTVLIVDDEAATRALLRNTVQGLSVPCRILEAVEGDTALELAKQEQPDLALVDIVLPGSSTSGVLVCRELLNLRGIQVVIVTGKATDPIVEACLSLGALECIRKPFSVEDVRGKLERWLAG